MSLGALAEQDSKIISGKRISSIWISKPNERRGFAVSSQVLIAHELGHELIYAANEMRKRKIQEDKNFHEFVATVSELEYLKNHPTAKTIVRYSHGKKLAEKFFQSFPLAKQRNIIIRELLLNENVTNTTELETFLQQKGMKDA